MEHEENSEATLRENSESKPINQTKEEEQATAREQKMPNESHDSE